VYWARVGVSGNRLAYAKKFKEAEEARKAAKEASKQITMIVNRVLVYWARVGEGPANEGPANEGIADEGIAGVIGFVSGAFTYTSPVHKHSVR
jgi:hypothetical protein